MAPDQATAHHATGLGESTLKVRRFDYAPIRSVETGIGAAQGIADFMDELGMQKALLLTTNSLSDSEILKDLMKNAGSRFAGSFSRSIQHIPESMLDDLLKLASEIKPDGVVTLGGGTVTDAGKAVALSLATGASTARELSDFRVNFSYPSTVDMKSFSGPFIPQIAIPTTLSAAEYDGVFGATLDSIKHLYLNLGLTPDLIVLDPTVTRATPQWLWASTGVRTLDHAVETYLSREPTAMTDACAVEAVRLIYSKLNESMNPEALDARLDCLIAGWLSMIGVHNVLLGLSHGIGHQLGARCNVPHGQTSCIMLPVVLEHMEPVIPERMALFAERIGIVADSTDNAANAKQLTSSVSDFIASLDVPRRLTQVGVGREDFDLLARDSMADMVVAFSPVDVTEQDIVAMLERAL